jgi:hypothetical protein
MARRSDASRTGVNISDIPIFPEDRREVETAADQMNLFCRPEIIASPSPPSSPTAPPAAARWVAAQLAAGPGTRPGGRFFLRRHCMERGLRAGFGGGGRVSHERLAVPFALALSLTPSSSPSFVNFQRRLNGREALNPRCAG